MASAGSDSIYSPPEAGELEISVFGPGYGEGILIHVGFGQWIVVDSCVDYENTPAALAYLKRLGVDPTNAIVCIVATHWHDDHIRGLHKMLDAASPSAVFVCSDIFQEKELLKLLAVRNKNFGPLGSGVDEFGRVFDTLMNASGGTRTPVLAVANKLLWRSQAEIPAELHALSPSDYACIMAKQALAQRIPSAGPARRVSALQPNESSVALWLKCGLHHVLLGADLENSGNGNMGWSCILTAANRPTGKAGIFKIPHHGSTTSYNAQVWTELLDAQPMAIVTPWALGGRSLPKASDMERVLTHSANLYATAAGTRRAPRHSKPAVERTMNEVARSRFEVPLRPGHVRIRIGAGDLDTPRIDLLDSALMVTSSTLDKFE